MDDTDDNGYVLGTSLILFGASAVDEGEEEEAGDMDVNKEEEEEEEEEVAFDMNDAYDNDDRVSVSTDVIDDDNFDVNKRFIL